MAVNITVICCRLLQNMPIKEKLANRNSRPLTAEMYENCPGFRAGSSLRCFPKSLPRWLARQTQSDVYPDRL